LSKSVPEKWCNPSDVSGLHYRMLLQLLEKIRPHLIDWHFLEILRIVCQCWYDDLLLDFTNVPVTFLPGVIVELRLDRVWPTKEMNTIKRRTLFDTGGFNHSL